MAYVLVSKTHKPHIKDNWFRQEYSNSNAHPAFTSGSLEDWLTEHVIKVHRSNVNVSTGNSTVIHHHVSNANVTVGNVSVSNITVGQATFATLLSWTHAQPGYKFHLHDTTDNTSNDIYVFDTQANGEAFRTNMTALVQYQAVMAYYASAGITQTWTVIP